MADNIQIRDGNEDLATVATEDIGGREVQLVKIGFGLPGTYQEIAGSNPLPVSGNFGSDQVSATILNFPSVQAVSGNLSVEVSATDLQFDGIKVTSANPLPIVGDIRIVFPETQSVSGTVSAIVLNQKDIQEVSGTVNTNIIFPEVLSIQGTVGVSSIPSVSATILNFPTIQAVSGNLSVEVSATDLQFDGIKVTDSNRLPVSGSVNVTNNISATIINLPSTQNINGIVGVSGTISANISNFPTTQNVSGSVQVSNFPSVQAVSGNLSVQMSATDLQYNGIKVTDINKLPVSGSFAILNPQTTVGISSTVSATILNLPSSQNINGIVGVSGTHGISGTVSSNILNFPTIQGISGSISANFPNTQNVNGVVGVSGTHGISGTVSATILNLPSSQNINGIVGVSGTLSTTVSNFPSVQAVSGNLSVEVSATDLQFDGTKITSANPLPITGNISVIPPDVQEVSGTVDSNIQTDLINYWPNMESIETEKVGLNVDPSGALQVRGAFTTDEGSYSTDFSGNTIYTILSGTCIFENGSLVVSGIGTSFLSQVSYGDFVKLNTDPLIDYVRVVTIISNTELELEYGYTGSSNTGTGYITGFEQIIEGDASLSVDRSLLIVNGGTQSNSLAQISRVVDLLPTAGILRNFSFSQNIPQSDCFFGFFDTRDYRTSNIAAFVIFTEAQTAQLITKTSNSSYDTNTVTFSLPRNSYIYTPARWKFEVTDDKVSVFYNDILLASSYNHLPPIYKSLNFNIGVFNRSVPETATVLYCDEVLFKNVDVINTASVLQSHVQMSYDSDANTILKELTSTMNSLQATLKSYASIMGISVDINGRQRMNVETGTVTASIASAQTLATVTTVGTVTTVTGQTNIGGYAANNMVPSNMNNSALFLRNNINVQ